MSRPTGPAPGSPWPPPPVPHGHVQHPGGPARRRRSRWLTLGLPIGAAVVVLGGALVWFLVGAVSDLTGSLDSAQQNTVAYADALVDGRWADAHALLCAESRSQLTPAALEEHYAGRDLTGYRITGVNVRNSNGVESGQIGITFTTADGLDDTTSIPLTREGEDWLPCP